MISEHEDFGTTFGFGRLPCRITRSRAPGETTHKGNVSALFRVRFAAYFSSYSGYNGSILFLIFSFGQQVSCALTQKKACKSDDIYGRYTQNKISERTRVLPFFVVRGGSHIYALTFSLIIW